MRYRNYAEYLESPEWKAKVEERAKIDKYRCCMCGASGTRTNGLECHHVTYRNIYHEDVFTDLLTLCRDCHCAVHRMMNRQTSADGKRGWSDTLSYSLYQRHTLYDKSIDAEPQKQ